VSPETQSLTIAAMAERASALLLGRAGDYGLDVSTRVPSPGKSSSRLARTCDDGA